MKAVFQRRDEVVFRFTDRMLREQRCSMGTFAQRVVDLYVERVPTEARTVHFKLIGDPFDCAEANAQKLKRYMDPQINSRLPVELEEAWVAALSEPYRSDCITELARRYGLLAVSMPTGEGALTDVQALVAVTDTFGKTMQSIAPTLDDGLITAADAKYVPKALAAVNQSIASLMAIRVRLEAVAMADGSA